MVFRASQIGKLMTNPRKKSEDLSETAKSYIRQLAKQDFDNGVKRMRVELINRKNYMRAV